MIPNYLQFIKFILFGGLAALVNIGLRFLLNFYFNYILSITLAYIAGMCTAFICFKLYVFNAKQSKKTYKEIIQFIIINFLGLLQTITLSIGFSEYIFPWMQFTFNPYDIAHVIGVLIPVITSYICHKYWTFQRSSYVTHKLG